MAVVEEEDLLRSEPVMSDSEDEVENGAVAKKHRQLVDALSILAGGKRRRVAERTEASGQVLEFDVSSGGADEKVLLSELLQPLPTSSALGSVRKQLSKAQQKKAAQLPLSKEESEQIVREAAYTQTSQALAKWDPVVRQNRRAEQLVFPLQQEGVAVAPVEEVVSSWQARTPLEEEIFSLLHKTQQPVKDPLLTPQEKASLQAMSLEEAQLRRRELQRARALQSYYEAKARRERKIKSKKYHKVLRKGRNRKALQEFEALQKNNPEAALEQLERMERARMEERMSLKHQNKGRWAKSTVLMAKYDLEARQAMQEQLARNKELTQRACPASESEEGGEASDAEGGLVPDAANEGPAGGAAPDNPWMLGKPRQEPAEDPPATEDGAGSEGEGEPPLPEEEEEEEEEEALLQGLQRPQGSGAGGGAAATAVLAEVLLPAPPSPVPEGPLLSEKLDPLRTLEELEGLAVQEEVPPAGAVLPPQRAPLSPPAGAAPAQPQGSRAPGPQKTAKRQALIDLKAVLAEAPHALQGPRPSAVQAEEEELETATDQRQMIREAFASDNVMADFLKEKRRAEQAGKPKAIDLVLPGWGEWGGSGLRPSAQKRRRFLLQPPPGPPRKDRHLPHVILSEQRNVLAAGHQVNQLPFPFENGQQFERSIQAPTGPTWNTQRAFQKLTAPRVLTQPGHIIRPISAEDANLNRQADTATGKRPELELTSLPKHRRRHHHPKEKEKAKAAAARNT
ncbi:U3 small nucleolar RNA-associated protein 14 homolog A [Hemicordylus capensis]|uniref:U3 small nucleolar RNA-associated protein 14 homolog A n=1 Tax=Hemicordylus capensis TaxID=884348 RepID=UPI0023028CE0|nr:U3 small nucleolar RNA-associated protein 14 homolog A [Hemicordylus capensis]XP_053129367.1 U3 small nucleolar RNA-associated protein 14 homolog A [Hemicordylus capensis]